MKSSRN